MNDQPRENGDSGGVVKKNAPGIPFKKGNRGRPKGVPNKINKSVAEMVKGALDAAGGQKWMEKQAREDPRGFGNLVSRLMPSKIEGTMNIGAHEAAASSLPETSEDAERIAIAAAAVGMESGRAGGVEAEPSEA